MIRQCGSFIVSALADLLSPRQAAQILGVSESTIRRWCDDERIPAARTHGRHRRIDRVDLLAFARREGLAVSVNSAAAAGRGGRIAPISELVERMYRALISADLAASRQLAISVLEHGVAPARLCDDIIAPAMHRVGDGWERGSVAIYQEHAATQAAMAAVMAARAAIAPVAPGAPLARCAALGGDPYSLGPAMAALVLQAARFDAMLVGPDTPAEQVALSIARDRPRLVAMSIGAVTDGDQLVDDVAAIRAAAAAVDTAVVIGGRGLDRGLRARMDAEFFGDTMAHLASFAGG